MIPTRQIQTLLLESALLTAEAQAVVALRAFNLARGGSSADAEYYRMYWKKWLAAWAQHWARARAVAIALPVLTGTAAEVGLRRPCRTSGRDARSLVPEMPKLPRRCQSDEDAEHQVRPHRLRDRGEA